MGSVSSTGGASKFKYITLGENGCYEVSTPLRYRRQVAVGYSKSLRKSWAIRNRIGKRIWGVYWGAVLAGFIDTVKSDTASVHVRFRGGAWIVHYRTLKDNKQKCKSFSCKKYGDQEAESLAIVCVNKLAKERFKQLENWNSRVLRVKR